VAFRLRSFRHRRTAGVLLACLLIGGAGLAFRHLRRARPVQTFPQKYWEETAPEAAGMSSRQLSSLSKILKGSGCVVRGGKMVYHWGLPQVRSNVWSASKPVIVHALLMALQQGKLSSPDEAVPRFEPRLNELNPDLAFKDRQITWQHFMSQTSCYGVTEPPGTAFDYSDFQIALFIDTLFGKVYGSSAASVDKEVMAPILYRPLQMQDAPYLGPFRQNKDIGRLHISPRDFCRFGLLYLRGGQWRGQQLLPPEVVKVTLGSPLPATLPRTAGKDAAMIPGQRSMGGGKNQEDSWGSYSNTWWVNGRNKDGKRLWEGVPEDTVGAFGQGGRWTLVIIPSLDLVASWADTTLPGYTTMTSTPPGHVPLRDILAHLVKAVRHPHK
jgi:CubicO group peptidase (beta-lactamase class C family)